MTVVYKKFIRPAALPRLLYIAPDMPKQKSPLGEVRKYGTAHRKPPAYLGKTLLRASTIAEWLAKNNNLDVSETAVRDVIWHAMDDARSAGFSAGVAWARGK